MKRFIKPIFVFVLIISIVFSGVVTSSASSKKYKYTKTTKRKYATVNGKKIGGDFHYQLIKIKGKSKVKKKINKTIKKDFKNHMKSWKGFKEILISTYESGTGAIRDDLKYYQCTKNAKVTLNGEKFFSIKQKFDWYAGGVHNGEETGFVFSKKTGKKLTLSSFVKGNKQQINNKVKKAFLRKVNGTESQYPRQMEIIEDHKISKYPIYITSKRVCVCFRCYELEMGNGYMVVSLKR